jgi:O-antigen/teichoic acid export membrane protein
MLNRPGSLKYLRNVSWLFVERVVRLLVVLFTGIYVARYLGAELFGQLNYATGFVGLFFALTTMGLDSIVVRDLVREPHRRNELLGTAALIMFLGSCLMLVLVAVSAFLKGMEPLTFTLVVVIAAAELLRPLSTVDHHFQAEVRAAKSVVVQMVQVLVSAGAKIALILMQADLIWFAWIYVLENLILGLGYVLAYRRDGYSVRDWRTNLPMARHLLSESWPLIIFGVALFVQAKIDQVMLGDLLGKQDGAAAGNEEVGQYSVALKMIESLGFLPMIVQQSLAPAVTKAKAMGQALYIDRLRNLYRLMFVMFLVTAIPLYLLAEPFIVLLYGEEFRPAGVLLALFAIRLFFTNMGVGKQCFITNESLFKYSLLTALVGASVNIAMNWFLIPEFRAIGAIWATIGSFTVSIFLIDLLFRNTRGNFKNMIIGIATFWRLNKAS